MQKQMQIPFSSFRTVRYSNLNEVICLADSTKAKDRCGVCSNFRVTDLGGPGEATFWGDCIFQETSGRLSEVHSCCRFSS
jgi:hypothetical protein